MLRDVVAQLSRADAGGDGQLIKRLPPRFTLFDLANDLSDGFSLASSSSNPAKTRISADRRKQSRRQVIKGLFLCLSQNRLIDRISEDAVAAAQIASYAAGLLRRSASGLPLPSTTTDDAAPTEEVLMVLRVLVVDYSAQVDDDTLLIVAAYTDSHAAWSKDIAASAAVDLLEHALSDDHHKSVFISSVVLDDFIRPVFSRSPSSRLTSTGRKAHYVDDENHRAGQHTMENVIETTPWKGGQLHAITVFAWAVEQSDEHLISKYWPLFTPVLLALTDDSDPTFKERGLSILQRFLSKCPVKLLNDTGLGEIFEQSIFPALMSLPTLTPETESLRLLNSAYSAAVHLAMAQFPDEQNRPQKNRLLARLLREGIFGGYWYASEYPNIVELLARQASVIVQLLGPFTIPHLKESN